ncbi:MAG: hypothetical protein SFU25_06495 [Candidatus Caenarcaniphilales bacterium]|nr:hypothetical protein [Candidatus Caenarcaniphilales bacterium]
MTELFFTYVILSLSQDLFPLTIQWKEKRTKMLNAIVVIEEAAWPELDRIKGELKSKDVKIKNTMENLCMLECEIRSESALEEVKTLAGVLSVEVSGEKRTV